MKSNRKKNTRKWENFIPQKLEGVNEYTLHDIAKVFSISPTSVQNCLNGRDERHNPVLVRKVKEFSNAVQYTPERAMHIGSKRGTDASRNANLSKRNFESVQQRNTHMINLRNQGYTNAQIAKLTGYTYATVRNTIGRQPEEYTQASVKRRGEFYHRRCEDRKALYAANRKKIDAANEQVEIYNSAVDELTRMCEAVVAQKSAVEKMRGTLSSCEKYATVPIREFTMLQN